MKHENIIGSCQGKDIPDEIVSWMADDLAKSGLGLEDIETVPFAPGRHFHADTVDNGGYGIVYRAEDGTEMKGSNEHPFVRLRFRPPFPERNGERAKYATPFRSGNRCFIQKNVFDYLTENPDAPLYLTEGEKKAAKANKEGFPVIGLAGIWNWLAPKQNRMTVETKYKINDDIVRFLHPDREVTIIYDSDSKENKQKAGCFDHNTLRLACELLAFQCPLYRVDVPQETEEKCGLDDYLMRHCADDFRQHVEGNRVLIPEEEAIKVRDPYLQITKMEGEPYIIKPTAGGTIGKVSMTQGWNARFLMENHQILYEPGENRFYKYNEENGLWECKSEDFMKKLLGDELGQYWRKYHVSEAPILLPWRTDRMLKDSINRLRGMAEMPEVFVRRLEDAKPIIHLPEGMLDLETRQVNEFSPTYYSRNQIAVQFDENAACPKFLNELLAPALEDDAIEALQKYFGMCVLGFNHAQQFLLLEGTAGGGKGTLTNILRNVIGSQNVAEMRTNQLNERFELAAFFDRTLLLGSDVPGNFLQRSGAEVLKKLTGHDFIEAEFKGSNRRARMFGAFNTIITSNNRLKIRLDGDEEAWRRRMILVRFGNQPPARKIANFARVLLKEEDKGILNWMIHGAVKALDDFREHGCIKVSNRIQEETDALLYESNSLNNFIDENMRESKGGSVTTSEFQSRYIEYCNCLNLPAADTNHVSRRLPELLRDKFGARKDNNIIRGDGTARGYWGVELTR